MVYPVAVAMCASVWACMPQMGYATLCQPARARRVWARMPRTRCAMLYLPVCAWRVWAYTPRA